MEPAEVKLIVAPTAGMLIGVVAVVVSPVGNAPRLMVGTAEVPVSSARTNTEKVVPGNTVRVVGLIERDKDGGVPPPPVAPPPDVPPPQPVMMALATTPNTVIKT